MESIKDKVAIVGMGCTKFGERWDMGVEDLLVEAAYEALEDAGIQAGDVQAAWLGTVFSGITAITMSPLGLQYIPMTRVENMCATGSEALRGAAYAVASGTCDIALAIGVVLGAQIGAHLSEKVQGGWIIRGLAIALGIVGLRILLVSW